MVEGETEILSPYTLQVNGTLIETKAIVFAVGVSSVIPREYQNFKDLLLTNETIFEMKRLPKSMLVVGTGATGLEIGQALHRLRVRVTLLGHKNKIGPLTDPAVLKVAQRVFAAELDIHPNHRLEGIERSGNGVKVRFRGRGGEKRAEHFEKILIAAGRRPNLSPENIKKLGIRLDKEGWDKFNERTCQMGRTHIFFAGDVNVTRPLLHEAAYEGRIAGSNAASYPRVEAFRRYTPLNIVFTDPQIAVVGQSWKELDLKKMEIGEVDYQKQGRAQIMAVNQGAVHLYANRRSGKLLGAEMFGPRMENMAHLMAWAMEAGEDAQTLRDRPFYHPVLEEGLQTALESVLAKIRRSRKRHDHPKKKRG
jgi:dihydrolipoamide dehydrogenase